MRGYREALAPRTRTVAPGRDRGNPSRAPPISRGTHFPPLPTLIPPPSPRRSRLAPRPGRRRGAIAQLGERLHGMQEVSGSIPLSSTNPTRRTVRAVGRVGIAPTSPWVTRAVPVSECPFAGLRGYAGHPHLRRSPHRSRACRTVVIRVLPKTGSYLSSVGMPMGSGSRTSSMRFGAAIGSVVLATTAADASVAGDQSVGPTMRRCGLPFGGQFAREARGADRRVDPSVQCRLHDVRREPYEPQTEPHRPFRTPLDRRQLAQRADLPVHDAIVPVMGTCNGEREPLAPFDIALAYIIRERCGLARFVSRAVRPRLPTNRSVKNRAVDQPDADATGQDVDPFDGIEDGCDIGRSRPVALVVPLTAWPRPVQRR